MNNFNNLKICVVGLGYVGLPLAVEFGKKFQTVGFDILSSRVDELKVGVDSTLECSHEELSSIPYLQYTCNVEEISDCNFYIITVPTPVDANKRPDLSPLISASNLLGSVLSKDDIVIYESTVYPGATEEDCVPVLEQVSGFKLNDDFFVGYSPERINPGDKERRLPTIQKVVSGSTPEVAEFINEVYKEIIMAGTHLAASIKIAEASKIIENIQRDVNIALVNELHQIFDKLGIPTRDVIEAASTKWNFMRLMPGLVGGHCIGVDPYYLLHKSQTSGYIPDLIRTAREINDSMPSYIVDSFLRELMLREINPIGCKVMIFGFTFKENCPDIRNTKNYDLYLGLKQLGFQVSVCDPWVDQDKVKSEYSLEISSDFPSEESYDVGLLAVGHSEILDYLKNNGINKFIYDFKGFLTK